MTHAEVDTILAELFANLFGRQIALTPSLSAADVAGWDSFKQIELILALEERFNIRFRSRDMDQLHNLGDLAALVRAKLAG